MAVSTIHEAKTQRSRRIARAERGEEVLIARGKEPVVRLVPLKKHANQRELGISRGSFRSVPVFSSHFHLKKWKAGNKLA
ncbi:MAG: hypothetical protein WBX22_12595 [Silvibacterium sp.]|jgi:antitoxin (DNA-binding transcriptional repressor) of toxin-antitoxin stability system